MPSSRPAAASTYHGAGLGFRRHRPDLPCSACDRGSTKARLPRLPTGCRRLPWMVITRRKAHFGCMEFHQRFKAWSMVTQTFRLSTMAVKFLAPPDCEVLARHYASARCGNPDFTDRTSHRWRCEFFREFLLAAIGKEAPHPAAAQPPPRTRSASPRFSDASYRDAPATAATIRRSSRSCADCLGSPPAPGAAHGGFLFCARFFSSPLQLAATFLRFCAAIQHGRAASPARWPGAWPRIRAFGLLTPPVNDNAAPPSASAKQDADQTIIVDLVGRRPVLFQIVMRRGPRNGAHDCRNRDACP